MQNNTLFLIARFGIYSTDTRGIFKSMMWLLTEEEEKMEYISFHREKSSRAYQGGRIISTRGVTEPEIINHQELMLQNNHGEMGETTLRKVITFEMMLNWNYLWPADAIASQMAYKGTGFLEIKK